MRSPFWFMVQSGQTAFYVCAAAMMVAHWQARGRTYLRGVAAVGLAFVAGVMLSSAVLQGVRLFVFTKAGR